MSQLQAQQVLGVGLMFPGRISGRRCINSTPEQATEGPDVDVLYSAVITGALPYQLSSAGIRDAQPSGGRPGRGVDIVYAKVDDPCNIFIPRSGPPQLFVFTESIPFDDCQGTGQVPTGQFFAISRTEGVANG